MDQSRPREAPAIFHFFYGADDEVKADLARRLTALYGTYEEWNYMELLRSTA